MADGILKLREARGYKGWATVEGRIFALNESASEKVQQTGMLSDGTGVARFVIFVSSEIESLEYDKSYRLGSVFVEMWNRQPSIKINRRSTITQIRDIDLTDDRPGQESGQEWQGNTDHTHQKGNPRSRRTEKKVRTGQQTISTAFT